jgi:acetyl esterase
MTTLKPQAARLLELIVAQGHPDASEVPIEQARANDLWLLEHAGERERVAEVREMTVPGPTGDVPVWAYLPDVPGPLPVLCYFHGGGWALGAPDYVDVLCRSLANRAGCIVLSADYRLAPEHPFPAGLHDCFAVVEWAAAHAASIGGDPARIAVGGESCGGNLAAAAALMARDAGGPEIVFQLLIYPTTDPGCDLPSFTENAETGVSPEEMRWFWQTYLGGASEDAPRAAILRADVTGMPPAYVLTAEADTLRDEAEAFAEKLRAAGVAATTRRFAGQVHGFVTAAGVVDDARVATDEMAAELRAAFAAQAEPAAS